MDGRPVKISHSLAVGVGKDVLRLQISMQDSRVVHEGQPSQKLVKEDLMMICEHQDIQFLKGHRIFRGEES